VLHHLVPTTLAAPGTGASRGTGAANHEAEAGASRGTGAANHEAEAGASRGTGASGGTCASDHETLQFSAGPKRILRQKVVSQRGRGTWIRGHSCITASM